MKIGILTQPLHTNYGGLLQAFALQKTLKNMGHEVWIENLKPHNISLIKRFKEITFIRKILGKMWRPTRREKEVIGQHTEYFVSKNITTTIPIYGTNKKKLKRYKFDAYVVGSDQVWRPAYSKGLENYFLNFAKDENVKRIAYAASFGVDKWEFSSQQTALCGALALKFDGISVRENSGVKLCKKYLGVDAVQLLDPTFLLDKEQYIKLVEKELTPYSGGNLMTYVLDEASWKTNIINKIEKERGLKSIKVMPKSKFSDVKSKGINDCIYPPVTEWIRGFMDAEFVVTDSFHGTVFAIIFNKPFITIGNKERGMSRFISLLSNFGLEDRLVHSIDSVSKSLINSPINFDSVNTKLEIEKEYAKEWLFSRLEGSKSV